MNPNTEYELFTQEVYQILLNENLGKIKNIEVKHDVKLKGRSGQEHQIDVYWEYDIAGVIHKVAIECKNYSSTVPIGKVRDFFGVLFDLNDVKGIMATKLGYQEGAKRFAQYHGINLKELRPPESKELIMNFEITTDSEVRHCLFQIDEKWAEEHKFDTISYRKRLDEINDDNKSKWSDATFIPLQTLDGKIRNFNNQIIKSIDDLEDSLPQKLENGYKVFDLNDAFINTPRGLVKINAIKFEDEDDSQTKTFAVDAQDLVKAIVKDALTGELQCVRKF